MNDWMNACSGLGIKSMSVSPVFAFFMTQVKTDPKIGILTQTLDIHTTQPKCTQRFNQIYL